RLIYRLCQTVSFGGTMKKILIAALVCAPTLVFAQPHEAYVSGHVGMTFVEDASISTSLGDAEATFDSGYNLGAALGYDYGKVRLEGEIQYTESDLDQLAAGV